MEDNFLGSTFFFFLYYLLFEKKGIIFVSLYYKIILFDSEPSLPRVRDEKDNIVHFDAESGITRIAYFILYFVNVGAPKSKENPLKFSKFCAVYFLPNSYLFQIEF